MNFKLSKKIFLSLIIIFCLALDLFAQVKIDSVRLSDGVVRYHSITSNPDKSAFSLVLEDFYNSIFKRKPPFNRTVAFLVGISEYQNLHDLPLVERDLDRLKSFLLYKGGVDTVFLVKNQYASPELIRRYMLEYFPDALKQDDRLIFYFSGHADDNQGNTGYLQFYNATKNVYWKNVLPITETLEWSKINKTKHILFIFDSCSSGLAFDSKGGDSNYYDKVLSSLSGNGSRIVLTAGSKGQKTYDGWFTSALLQGLNKNEKEHFITAHDLYSTIQKEVAKIAAIYNKKITPKLWELENYEGTFIFINPNKINGPFPNEINAFIKSKGDIDYNSELNNPLNTLALLGKETGKLIIILDSLTIKKNATEWIAHVLEYRLDRLLKQNQNFFTISLRTVQHLYFLSMDDNKKVYSQIDIPRNLEDNIFIFKTKIDSITINSKTIGGGRGPSSTIWSIKIKLTYDILNQKVNIDTSTAIRITLSGSDKTETISKAINLIIEKIENHLLSYHPYGVVKISHKKLNHVWLNRGFKQNMSIGEYYQFYNPKTLKAVSRFKVIDTEKDSSKAIPLFGCRSIKRDFIVQKSIAYNNWGNNISLQYIHLPFKIEINQDLINFIPSSFHLFNLSYMTHSITNNIMPYGGINIGEISFDSKKSGISDAGDGWYLGLSGGVQFHIIRGYLKLDYNTNLGGGWLNQKLTEKSKLLIKDKLPNFDDDKASSYFFAFRSLFSANFIIDSIERFNFCIGLGFTSSTTSTKWTVNIKKEEKDQDDESRDSTETKKVDPNLLPIKSMRLDGMLIVAGLSICF